MNGVLLKAFGGFYFVQAEGTLYACSLRGRLKQELKDQPLGLIVGDRVTITPLAAENARLSGAFAGAPPDMPKAVVETLLTRQNYLIRPKIANVEQCLIVLAARHPKPDWLLLDRLLAALFAANIRPLLLVNKIDQPGAEALLDQLTVYQKAGCATFAASAATGEGIAELAGALSGHISTVAGQSGVGKSTLLNLLQQGQQLKTGEISQKLRRGRHTTRTVELLPLADGGWLADTPGFSRLALPQDLRPEQLSDLYPDFAVYAAECRFAGCRHADEPDCRVKAAVQAGELDAGRYQRYLTLLAELAAAQEY